MSGKQVKVRILSNFKVNDKYFKLGLESRGLEKQARPGQFIMLEVSDIIGPLLRRPLSIHDTSAGRLELLYEVIGKGTTILSQRKPGEYLDIIGPLGNGFSIAKPQSSILVAGGMGVAPLVYLAKKMVIRKSGNQEIRNPLVLIGAKTKRHILCESEFKKLGYAVKVATDDGSRGLNGRVSELLQNTLSTIDYRLSTIYACGPHLMLKEVARIAQEHDIPAQVSLEAHMACGIGACLGCVVETKDGYRRVCKDGPVFKAQELTY